MRITYVTMQFPAPSETFASNDVRELARSGEMIEVHGLRPEHPDAMTLAKERDVRGVSTTHTTMGSLLVGAKIALARPRLAWELVKLVMPTVRSSAEHFAKSLALLPRVLEIYCGIERSRPDVVHIYWGHYPSLVGHLVQRHMPKTVVSVSLAAYDLEMEYGPSSKVAQRAHFVRTLGHVNVADIHDKFGVERNRIRVIPDGVDLERLDYEIAGEATLPKRVVSAGRLIRSKGMSDVLHVFRNVATDHPDASLVILGAGPERESLQRQAETFGIAHAVSFLGHVDQRRVFLELARAKVFLFMSSKSSERLPNVVKEAMGCRCLCISTQSPGMNELLQHGESGWIVAPGDVDAATQHLAWALEPDSDVEVAKMTALARAHIEFNFELRSCMRDYVSEWNAHL